MNQPNENPNHIPGHGRIRNPVQKGTRRGGPATKLGVRNADLSTLTGMQRSHISGWVRRHGVERYTDLSYNTDQVESLFRGRPGMANFVVPAEVRGTQHQVEPETVTGIVVHAETHGNGTNGHVSAQEIVDAERMYLYYRTQNEMLQAQMLNLKLEVEKGNLIARDVVQSTVGHALKAIASGVQGLGAQVAGSLAGLDDEFEIKRRIDEMGKTILGRMREELKEMVE